MWRAATWQGKGDRGFQHTMQPENRGLVTSFRDNRAHYATNAAKKRAPRLTVQTHTWSAADACVVRSVSTEPTRGVQYPP